MINNADWRDRLASYLAGSFDNREQAIAEPAWYVHVRLWHRPIALFGPDSLGFYAEQASSPTFDRPYRPRVFQIRPTEDPSEPLQAVYFALKQPERWRGAGQDPDRLRSLTMNDLDALPGCHLSIAVLEDGAGFRATPPSDCRCCFTVDGQLRQVQLGFEARPDAFDSFDKGIDPDTGKPLWGAIMGPFRYRRIGD
jgi:hypothetical protein